MTVLVTGGSGFVGLNLLEQLLERGETVVNGSLAPPPSAAQRAFRALPGTLHSVELDVTDAAAVAGVFAAHSITHVIHGAAVTAGPERERRDAAGILAANVQGTVNVLDAAHRAGVRRVVYPSSGSVYGENAFAADVLDEHATHPVPVTLYGISKYAAERVALRYRTLHGMDVVAARLGIVFGRWEHDTGLRDTLSPIYHLTRMAQAGEEAVLPNPGSRDWIYAPDVAAGLLALLDQDVLPHALYHVGSGSVWSAAEWCERLRLRFADFRFRVAEEEQDHAVNVNLHRATGRAPLSIHRIRTDTGFTPKYGLDGAFADYLNRLGQANIE